MTMEKLILLLIRWSSLHTTVNKAPVGRNVDETKNTQGYQYVAANPDEVCPANWTPEKKPC